MYKVVSHYGFVCVSLMISDIEHHFMYLLATCINAYSNPLPVKEKNGFFAFV